MTDHPSNDPEQPLLGPFPTTIPVSPFPPVEGASPPAETPADPPSDWIETADAHDLPTRENALVALGRFAFPPAPEPDEEGVAARDRRWTSRTVLIATAFLLIFNAVSIQNWSSQQPPGWTTATVEQLADVWAAQIAQLGADQPRLAVRDAYGDARDGRFPGQDERPE